MTNERIILNEYLDERDIPTREPAPANDTGPRLLMPVFAPVGAGRGVYEEAARAVEYLPPGRRVA